MFKLQDALKALDGREEFVLKRRDGLVVVNYLIQLPDSFDGIRANFRGVVFNETSGDVVSLPLHKFFNVGQKPDTQIGLIGHMDAQVHEKFDGTMCHALEVGGDIVLASRMGWDTEQAEAATRFMLKQPWKDAVAKEVREGKTPVFEYVGPNNPVVIQYKDENLEYLWSRDRVTGKYSRNLLLVPTDRVLTRIAKLSQIMDEVLTLQDKEGYVCVLENGMWVKAKSPWYLDRHQAFDMLMRPAYRIYEVALQGKLDDLIGQSADLYKPKLELIALEVAKDQLRLHREVQAEYESLFATTRGATEHDRRKAFALAAKPSPLFGALMSLYSNKPVDAWINARLFDVYKAKYPGRLFAIQPDET